jgi:hypothetical protein
VSEPTRAPRRTILGRSATSAAGPGTADPETAEPETADGQEAPAGAEPGTAGERRDRIGPAATTGDRDPDQAGSDLAGADTRDQARLGPPWWWVAAIAVVSVLALVLALAGLNQRSKLHGQRATDLRLRQVSGQLVGALTTYDYQHLDGFRSSVLANATGAFARDFDSRFPALGDVLVADKSRATGTVSDIFVGAVDASRATTLVRVIYTVTGLSGTRQIGSYDTLTVLKVGGRWQVDDIQTLLFNPSANTASPSAGGTTTPSSPSTTAPAGSAPSTTRPGG